MMTAKQSATRYEIEWVSSIPKDENGDSIMDAAVYECRDFPTMDEAKRAAWQVLRDGKGKLPWEIVTIEKQERELNEDLLRYEGLRRYSWERVEHWETTADGEEPYRID